METPHYVCAPKKAYIPHGHPAAFTIFVREDALLDMLNQFLSTHVFGTYRKTPYKGYDGKVTGWRVEWANGPADLKPYAADLANRVPAIDVKAL
jgi:hypothetical protein